MEDCARILRELPAAGHRVMPTVFLCTRERGTYNVRAQLAQVGDGTVVTVSRRAVTAPEWQDEEGFT